MVCVFYHFIKIKKGKSQLQLCVKYWGKRGLLGGLFFQCKIGKCFSLNLHTIVVAAALLKIQPLNLRTGCCESLHGQSYPGGLSKLDSSSKQHIPLCHCEVCGQMNEKKKAKMCCATVNTRQCASITGCILLQKRSHTHIYTHTHTAFGDRRDRKKCSVSNWSVTGFVARGVCRSGL